MERANSFLFFAAFPFALCGTALILAPSSALAETLDLTSFRVSEIAALQANGANSFSGEVSWNPTYFFSQSIFILANVGGSLFKGVSSDFVVTEYEVLAGITFLDNLEVEAGAGAQTWFDSNSTNPLLSTDLAWKLSQKQLGFIDRVFVGYSAWMLPGNLTHEIKLGIGVAF